MGMASTKNVLKDYLEGVAMNKIVTEVMSGVVETVVQDHWLNIAQKCPSPNCNLRPNDEISLIVLHNISLPPKQYGGPFVEDFFCNRLDASAHPYFLEISHLEVSSHLFIRRDGSVIQFVPFNQRAWHAGLSRYGGRDNCNDFSIGIEMEGCDDEAYCQQQYASLQRVAQALMRAYPMIKPARITGHEFISAGRKTDPGRAFKWQKLFLGLNC
jgi:AmpD protein